MLNKKKPAHIVIFGGNGDLTWRKLVPAFYNLFISGELPENFAITCVDYVPVKESKFKNHLQEGVSRFSRTGKTNRRQWNAFASVLQYLQGDFKDPFTYHKLGECLSNADKDWKQRGTRMFYFAVSPGFIETIADAVAQYRLGMDPNHDRIVVEKPFGTDLYTARILNRFLLKRFKEQQVYRIDHYLGKETVQNILAFRFANSVFEPLWNAHHIDHVQISVSETVSIGKRGGYYDASGAIRDMIQNHLLQLLCVTAMDCPKAYNAETIRNAKAAVLKLIKPISPHDLANHIVLGQYTSGTNDGQPQSSYRKEENVARGSVTETFAALRLFINNKRWKDVPFFLRTGKCLPRQSSVIIIQFKHTPHPIFRDDVMPNRLIISVQPEQEISLLFESKVPGLQMKLKPVEMDFTYKESYSEAIPEAYEALLLDVLIGDATLFMRADQVESAWKVVTPLIKSIQANPGRYLHFYKAGTWGPTLSKKLLAPYARDWFSLPEPVTGNLKSS